MRHVKPQSALVATTATQFGAYPMLGISLGIGFRMSNPLVLVHEASVWEGLKAAKPSVALYEAAMPKQRAEWLLAGHATAPVDPYLARQEWTAWAKVADVRKTVSCAVPTAQSGAETCIRLAVDACNAAAGAKGENPSGIGSGSPPLQKMGVFGIGPDPLAAMGALGLDWPERAQRLPQRSGDLAAMEKDGTHMGWPAQTDLRYFQQAAPDQWSKHDTWPAGAPFELRGFGDHGTGFNGRLPRLQPVGLVSRRDEASVERLSLRQQTLWFLPDFDIAVMWWNGSIPLDYLLDDSPSRLITAFRSDSERIDLDALVEFADMRGDLSCTDPLQHADHALMPTVEEGWTWEMILDMKDHPRFSPAPRPYSAVRARVAENRAQLFDASEAFKRLNKTQLDQAMLKLPPPVLPPESTNWRKALQSSNTRTLSQTVVRDADFTSLQLNNWTFKDVRFERCTFNGAEFSACQFEDTYAADCSFADTKWRKCSWTSGAFHRCHLVRSQWLGTTAERLAIDACHLDDIRLSGGSWSKTTLLNSMGERGHVEDMTWRAISWSHVEAKMWKWERLQVDGLTMIECNFGGLRLEQGSILKAGILVSNLMNNSWKGVAFTYAVISEETTMQDAHLSDCVFKSSSFQSLALDRAKIDHCSFLGLSAQRLHAPGSFWQSNALEGANFLNANLVGASFTRCNLKEAMLYGADLNHCHIGDCNLVRLRTGWSLAFEADSRNGNVTTGLVSAPKRSAQ
jgi:uncharacterized protein YjbI with pentapeptide repeats